MKASDLKTTSTPGASSRVIKPPKGVAKRSNAVAIFLAGSIEMGSAEDWQAKVEKEVESFRVDIYNPRRDDWDNSWEQSLTDKNFAGQVKWEHDHLTSADFIFFYFDPNTKSPISLMELGLFAGDDEKTIYVVCPDGFWRKGNVEFICEEYDINLYNTLDEGIEALVKYLKFKSRKN